MLKGIINISTPKKLYIDKGFLTSGSFFLTKHFTHFWCVCVCVFFRNMYIYLLRFTSLLQPAMFSVNRFKEPRQTPKVGHENHGKPLREAARGF